MSMAMSPNAPWGAIPPPPGTQVIYGIPTSKSSQTPPAGLFFMPYSNSNAKSDAPAYTPVPVRQNFTYAPTQVPYYPPQPQYASAPPPEQPPMKKKKIDWPLPVRHYVQRSFDPSNMVPDVTKSDMEAKLKETISAATDSDSLHSIDWDNLPLPQQMIRNERVQATLPWRNAPVDVQMVDAGYQTPPQENLSKKRKSGEANGADDDLASPPPWRITNNRNGFEDRITYVSQSPAIRFDPRPQASPDDVPLKTSSKFQKNLEKRQRRFDGGYKSTYQRSPTPEASSGPVVGKCTTLEKKYFRLTAPPNPDTVRPLPILKQTLELLKKKWRKEGNYSYICDQFKSLRQDLTVQHIKDKFTVEVYEIHARIALEKGDLGEYNQCQTQLRALYEQKLGGNPMEFKAYRILYFIHTCNRTALNDVLTDLTTAEKEDPAIKHALSARSALALGNYHKFFRLYLETPNMGAYLMDMFVVRERLAALANICKA
jgi:SAC3 family protein LENG8/THP3